MNEYIKVLKNYATFGGRARRREYWMFVLFNMIISIVIGIIAGVIRLPILGTLYSLATLVPAIAVGVRRMHDVGKPGWFLIIPIYNLILACTPGNSGANAYGDDPIQQAQLAA